MNVTESQREKMKLGEIKMQALRLMFVQAADDYTADEISQLERDEECKDYIANMPGAINRCLANLESRDVLPVKRAVLSVLAGESYGGRVRYDLPHVLPDLFKVERVAWESEDGGYISTVRYLKEGDSLMLSEISEKERYIILYRPRATRINAYTNNDTELNIPEHIAALIPYYVKSELYRIDEPDEAQEARNLYETGLAEIAYETEGVQTKVASVYSMGGD